MPTPVDEYIKTLHDVQAFLLEKQEEGVKPLREEVARMTTAVVEAQRGLEELKRERLAKMDDYGRLYVTSGRLGGLSPIELGVVKSILRGRAKHDPRLVRSGTFEAIAEAEANLRRQITFDAIERWVERSMRMGTIMSQKNMDSPGGLKLRDSLLEWRNDFFRQINRAMDSTTAGSGDELVPTFEAAEVWLDVNLATNVLPLFRQQPMPTSPFTIPAQLGDTNWYPTSENIQGLTTDLATKLTTLTAYGVKTGVPFSDELEEDAIIAFAAELRATLARNAAEVIDDLLLNADATTGVDNINHDGATITTSLAGKAHYLLGFDGLVHLPFVDNTAQRTRVAGALANTTYNNLLIRMGKYAAPSQRGDVVFIAPINVVLKTLQLAQVETVEKYGPRATIVSGEITSIYGTPLIISAQFGLADTTGEVRSASSNNTTGRILGVNTTQWRVGFRRSITFEPDREPGKSQTTLYVSFRIAFSERTGTKSSATHTALQYDISSVT